MDQIHNDFAVRAFLLGALHRAEPGLPTYGELARYFGGSNQGQEAVLNRLAKQCEQRQEPDLTVLVVNTKDRRPSRFKGRSWSDDQWPTWRQELTNVRSHQWSNEGL